MQTPPRPTPRESTEAMVRNIDRELAEIEQAIGRCRGDLVAEPKLTGTWMAHLLICSKDLLHNLLIDKTWAPLSRSFAGLPELPPSWVAEHRGELTLLDVRSAEEFHGPDGHVTGSLLIPLPELEQRSGEIPSGRPVVVLCHSGSRSALATQQLLKAGHSQVANLLGSLWLPPPQQPEQALDVVSQGCVALGNRPDSIQPQGIDGHAPEGGQDLDAVDYLVTVGLFPELGVRSPWSGCHRPSQDLTFHA